MTIKQRIFSGLLAILPFVGASAVVGYWGVSKLHDMSETIIGPAWDVADNAMEGTINFRASLNHADMVVATDDAGEHRAELKQSWQASKASLLKSAEVARANKFLEQNIIDELESYVKKFDAEIQFLIAMSEKKDELRAGFYSNADKLATLGHLMGELGDVEIEKLEKSPDELTSWNMGLSQKWYAADSAMHSSLYLLQQLYHIKRIASGADLTAETTAINEGLKIQEEAYTRIMENPIFDAKVSGSDARSYKEVLKPLFEKHKEMVTKFSDMKKALIIARIRYEKLAHDMIAFMDKYETSADNAVEGLKQPLADQYNSTISMLIGITVGVLLVAFMIQIWLVKSIGSALSKAVETLRSSAENVNVAAEEIANGGSSLARASSDQAASLEETAATVEEVSSSAQHNSDSANELKNVAEDVRTLATKSGESMDKVNEVIVSIKQAADETQDILKAIDDIAFQTNLLALNAAVEAARAGDAGKGFAVVAEEVRALAQRSATAAKSTAEKIKNSNVLAEHGVKVAMSASELLKKIEETTDKSMQLTNQIVDASKEQAIALSQITTSISRLDQVSQSNAASSQEFAATSAQIVEQGHSMESTVTEIVHLLGD